MTGSAVRTFTDPHEYQTFTCDAQHRVVITAPGIYRAETTRIDLPLVTMRRASQSLPSISHLAVPTGRSAICFPVDAGDNTAVWGGQDVPSGGIFVVSSGGEFHSRSRGGARWASLSLSSDALAAFAEASTGAGLEIPAAMNVMRPQAPAMARLLAVHHSASELASSAPDVLERPEVAKVIEENLMQAAISCLVGSEMRESRQPARKSIILRFENYLEANPDRPLHVLEVCGAVGVSERTLRMHCQAHLGISPQRYLWLRRMHQARRKLAVADPGRTTVTEVATEHGFWELGRFSAAYRTLFGELPSATLRRSANPGILIAV